MIYEIRTYRLAVGKLPEYLSLVEKEGLPIQKEHLGNLIGYFYSELGPLNQIVHIWAYADLLDREMRRGYLEKDPRWAIFAPKIQSLILEMEAKIMRPTGFSPLN